MSKLNMYNAMDKLGKLEWDVIVTGTPPWPGSTIPPSASQSFPVVPPISSTPFPKKVKIGGTFVEVSTVGGTASSILSIPTKEPTGDPYGWIVIVQNYGMLNQFINVGVKRRTKCGKYFGAWTSYAAHMGTKYQDDALANDTLEWLKKSAKELSPWETPKAVKI